MNDIDLRDAARDFLMLVIAGKIDEAYQKYVDIGGRHHNFFTPSGFAALQAGMQQAESQTPGKQFTIKHIVVDNDLAVVHSHLIMKPDDPGMATVHILRFANNKVAELWDCAQPIPKDLPNSDGPF